MELLYILLVLLVVTRAFAEVAERAGQPALVGELTAGILVGTVAAHYSSALPVLSGLTEDEVFGGITDLAIFFLMLLAGLEMRPRALVQASGGALGVALGGMVLPLALGVGLGFAYLPESPLRHAQVLFLGVALAITAVPVSVKVLMDLGLLESRLGRVIVSSALVDDVLSLILLAALTSVIETGSPPAWEGVLAIVLRVAVFFAAAVAIGRYALPALGKRIRRRFALDELELSFLLVVALGFAVLAELLGMHFIIGAFVAGLLFERRTIDPETHQDVHRKVSGITKGFLAPLFFASIGLHLDLEAVGRVPVFVAMLIAAAAVGKILGSGLPARLLGFSRREAAAIGFGMNARGAVELVIADVALRAGLFGSGAEVPPIVGSLYSAVVVVAIITTLVTPIALRLLLEDDGAAR
jgi:Kef-type K+ transport system membrane component KefB